MEALQTNLFYTVEQSFSQPLIIAYGLGVNSTAVLIELHKRNIRPDAILFADTGNEKAGTYAYLPVINAWLNSVGFPLVTIVRYEPKTFKAGRTYSTLGEECISNKTLPSLAFGFKSCSMKWKVAPQNTWTNKWRPAIDYWHSGGKVKKIIGYDAGKQDMKRYAHSRGLEDAKYEYWYPLIKWNMDRGACKLSILSAGLPLPPKSACTFCPATRPEELHTYSRDDLKYIVSMETLAKSRLQGLMTAEQLINDFNHRHAIWSDKVAHARGRKLVKLLAKEPALKKIGSGCAGLWRSRTRSRPAMMTDYIVGHGLLSAEEIQHVTQDCEQSLSTINSKEVNAFSLEYLCASQLKINF